MKNSRSFFIYIVSILCILISLAGCATTVPIKSVRTPTIDTSNVRRLAVRPFENRTGNRNDGARLARDITEKVTQMINATGKFTMVAASDPNANGIFTGEITRLVSNESRESNTVVDSEGNESIEYTYTRQVILEFSYMIIDSRTDLPIGQVRKEGSQSTSASSLFGLTSVLELANDIVDSQLRGLESDIIPTIVSTEKKLVKETLKDKAAKQRMKDTLVLVKNNNYEAAIDHYEAIAAEFGSTAARTNANILREAIQSDIYATSTLVRLENERGGLSDKAVEAAAQELYAKLPANAVIIVMEGYSQDRTLLSEVVNRISGTVLSEGRLKVVDRSRIMQEEMEYQVSGYVSDDSYIEFGQHVGAQYIVLFQISGQMSTRRLNMRAINIETSEIMTQIGFDI
ncbi:MAG: hypothetical protein LBV20_05145 [Treponema sp.]|jgi:hypothetical protein|nr:hypothetical protein [Treponema sp.]